MRIRWPFTLRSNFEAEQNLRLAIHADFVDMRKQHAAELAGVQEQANKTLDDLRAEYQSALEAARAEFRQVTQRRVLAERERCAGVVAELPASSRGAYIRDRALDGILRPPQHTGTTTTTHTPATTAESAAATAPGGE